MTRGQKQATNSSPQIIAVIHSRKLYRLFIVVVFVPGIRAGNDSVAECQEEWKGDGEDDKHIVNR